jgi:hypothetical protein
LLRYFIPMSHVMVTMVVFGRDTSAKHGAATASAPVEVPAKRPFAARLTGFRG